MNDRCEEYKMFIESNELKNRIKAVSDAIYEQTDHQVVFEEFIAIPHYGGNIILRYNLLSQHYTLDDLDCYEEAMNILYPSYQSFIVTPFSRASASPRMV